MPGALTLRFGDDAYEVEPGRGFRIGRGSDADLVIANPDVSRLHVVLRSDDDGWWVEDLGSANGTYLDGLRISRPMLLPARSEVRLGSLDSPAALLVEAGALVAEPDVGGTVLKGSNPQPFRDRPAPPPLAAGVTAVTLGSATDNDVVIRDINVSRHHARVVHAESGFLVEDLNSLNGTLLNAAPVQRGFMTDADVLTLGNTDFVRRDGRLVRAATSGDGDRGLVVDRLELTLPNGRRLIGGVDLTATRGTLTAVIGPSGAGKSTLAGLLAGVTVPTAGRVGFDGFDLQRDYQAVKTRVGLVPQEDVVHRQLVLRRALRYAADLRLPSGLPATAKDEQVDRILDQLGLERHAATRIAALSGGQRKRASVAMELLTEPSLLILDEPTSGLDPALDRQVMRTLRDLADGDRTVLVITHSVAYLDLCDQVLVLAPGGLTAYLGPAAAIGDQFGTTEWADVFAGLADDPEGAHARWSEAAAGVVETHPTQQPALEQRTVLRSSSRVQQWATVAARQCAVMLADRGYLAFLLALPVILGLLPWVVSGSAGLTAVPRDQPDHAGEPTTVLALLVLGATFMGVAMSIRDLIGERSIFLRERAVGLSPTAYLLAKLTVFGAFSLLVAAIMTAVSMLVKSPPDHDLFGLGPPVLELYVAIAATTWVAAALGLLLSSLVTSSEQVMPVLILVVMVQLVLHGGLLPVIDRDVLDVLSRFVPARWGFAAAASGIDLEALLAPGRPVGSPPAHRDPLWAHTAAQWLRDTGALVAFGVVLAALADVRLRAQRR